MVKYKWFGVDNPELNLDVAIVMPNHLGASLDKDFGYKACRVAAYTGRAVLAYERPHTGSQATFTLAAKRTLSRDNYVLTAAQTGRNLDKILSRSGMRKHILAGNSAGALDVAVIAATRALRPDYLAIGDIVGVRKVSFLKGLRDWWQHQQVENALPAEQRNTDPGPPIPTLEMSTRAIKEMGLYGNVWQTPLGASTLVSLASHEDFENIAVNVEFPGHTFTSHTASLQLLVGSLNSLRSPDAPRAFVASYEAGRYHSYYDDPHNFSAFVGRTLLLAA